MNPPGNRKQCYEQLPTIGVSPGHHCSRAACTFSTGRASGPSEAGYGVVDHGVRRRRSHLDLHWRGRTPLPSTRRQTLPTPFGKKMPLRRSSLRSGILLGGPRSRSRFQTLVAFLDGRPVMIRLRTSSMLSTTIIRRTRSTSTRETLEHGQARHNSSLQAVPTRQWPLGATTSLVLLTRPRTLWASSGFRLGTLRISI